MNEDVINSFLIGALMNYLEKEKVLNIADFKAMTRQLINHLGLPPELRADFEGKVDSLQASWRPNIVE